MQDAGWLKRYTDLGEPTVPARSCASAGFEELHFLRRYCAKLIYETQLYGGDVRWESLPDLYVDLLTDGDDVPVHRAPTRSSTSIPRYYSARYLRAWQLQALLDETLVERYDDDWWRNPRAGPWIVAERCSPRDSASWRTSRRSACRAGTLSFAPLIREIERALS